MPERLAVLTACVLLSVLAAHAAAPSIDADRAQELSSLVRQDCGSCHGLTLRGGLGSDITPEALADTDVEEIAEIVRDGLPGTPMPPWLGIVTEEEAVWIAHGLKQGRFR